MHGTHILTYAQKLVAWNRTDLLLESLMPRANKENAKSDFCSHPTRVCSITASTLPKI
jgi:hypothetical protein